MKLNDILTEMPKPAERKTLRQTAWTGPREVASWLKQKGFRRIGGGLYSVAYARPRSDKVIKFSKREDKCWLRFARVAKGMRSRHLPRIYDLIEYENKKGETMFISVIEKLKPVKFDQIDWTGQNRFLLAWLINESVIYQIKSKVKMKEAADIIGFEFDPKTNTVNDFDELIKKYARKYQQSNRSFANIYRTLKSKVGKSCWMDIHDGNVYYRPSTNSFVFLDPYA